MCPAVFPGADEQRRCRCIPRSLEIRMSGPPFVNPFHRRKPIFTFRYTP